MIQRLVAIILLSLTMGCQNESSLILENANIINVATGTIDTYNVLIKGTKISKISKEHLGGDNSIDLKEKYIIPSMWDMHVHIQGDRSKLSKFFDQGVLGIRDLGAFRLESVDSLVKWKRELNENKSIQLPVVEYAGLINNDTTCYQGHRHIANYKDLLDSYNYSKDIGSSYYKVHNCFPYHLLPQLDSLAQINNFKFGGHIPEGIDPLQYINQFDNINSIEHVSVLLRALSFRKENPLNITEAVRLLDGTYLDSLAHTMKEKNIAFTPNLLSEVEFIKSYPEAQKHLGENLLKKFRAYVKRLSDHGVILLAGTDNNIESDDEVTLFQELALLSQAGLTPLQVLQSATINADKTMGKPLNLVQENMAARFIILNNNPLEDLTALQSVSGIVQYGSYTEIKEKL